MDAVVDILAAHGMRLTKKWVDDLVNVREPTACVGTHYTYSHTIHTIFDVTTPLGVPWKRGKCFDYAFEVVYLGFLWNLPLRSVSLPEPKRLKYLAKLEAFLGALDANKRVNHKQAMSVNGTLSHLTFVYPHGRTYLTSLSAFIGQFSNRHAPRYAPHSVRSDMRWWYHALCIPAVSRSLTPRGAVQDFGIYVDASTSWGIGIVIGSRIDAWHLRDGWARDSRDIGWAEMIAVELAVRHCECLGHSDSDILIRSDNMGVVGAFTRGRSRNYQVNDSIRRAEVIGMARNLRFVLDYVNTCANVADPVSRGILDPAWARLPVLQLPSELFEYLVHA